MAEPAHLLQPRHRHAQEGDAEGSSVSQETASIPALQETPFPPSSIGIRPSLDAQRRRKGQRRRK
ncbi:unnamed protein product, partial [Nesidiocoris tenuis]